MVQYNICLRPKSNYTRQGPAMCNYQTHMSASLQGQEAVSNMIELSLVLENVFLRG